jgi:hypothetical protein
MRKLLLLSITGFGVMAVSLIGLAGQPITVTQPSAIAPFISEGTSVGAIRSGPLTHQFRVYEAYTDASNFSRINLTTNATWDVLQSETQVAGVNSVSQGMCISANNNVVNRWCVGGNPATSGLFQGSTPSLVYSIVTPTISSGFGTSPSIAGKGSSFRVTVGTGTGIVTGVVAFGVTFTNIPACSANDEVTANYLQAVPTTTQVTVNGAMSQNDTIAVTCIGY